MKFRGRQEYISKTRNSKTIKLGILGLGEGVNIPSAAFYSKLAEPHILCDLNEELCQKRFAGFSVERYSPRCEEMLADPAAGL